METVGRSYVPPIREYRLQSLQEQCPSCWLGHSLKKERQREREREREREAERERQREIDEEKRTREIDEEEETTKEAEDEGERTREIEEEIDSNTWTGRENIRIRDYRIRGDQGKADNIRGAWRGTYSCCTYLDSP